MGEMWNLWHGCHKKSEGCQHCYVYRRDAEFEKDSNIVTKTASFNLPIRRDRQGNWKVPSGSLMWTCFTSDFFIEEADEWREDAWLMIHRRSDLHFFMITKRPERIAQCLPEDWGDGYKTSPSAVRWRTSGEQTSVYQSTLICLYGISRLYVSLCLAR